MTPHERRKLFAQPRRKKNGHAMPPGTGPEGETCKTCVHLTMTGNGGKSFSKCGLMRSRWTSSYGTDILQKDPACSKWEPKKENPA